MHVRWHRARCDRPRAQGAACGHQRRANGPAQRWGVQQLKERDLSKERCVEWSSEQLQDCQCCTGVLIARKAQAISCACARRSEGPRLLPSGDRACHGWLGEAAPVARGPPHRRRADAFRAMSQPADGNSACCGEASAAGRAAARRAKPLRRGQGGAAVRVFEATAPCHRRAWPKRRAPTARGPPQQRWVAAVPIMHFGRRRSRMLGRGPSRWPRPQPAARGRPHQRQGTTTVNAFEANASR